MATDKIPGLIYPSVQGNQGAQGPVATIIENIS